MFTTFTETNKVILTVYVRDFAPNPVSYDRGIYEKQDITQSLPAKAEAR